MLCSCCRDFGLVPFAVVAAAVAADAAWQQVVAYAIVQIPEFVAALAKEIGMPSWRYR